jgi:T5SS/PEP-CTERM-associated repeat protein
LALAVLSTLSKSAIADIVPTGEVSPANPAGWTSSTQGKIGVTGAGGVTVNDGSVLLSMWGILGDGTSAAGTVMVSGGGWNNAELLRIGNSGAGSLGIANAGSVNVTNGVILGGNAGASGELSINGSGSVMTIGAHYGNSSGIIVGNLGIGTVTVSGGGSLISTSGVYTDLIGLNAGSAGSVLIEGAGSLWSASSLMIGYKGTGALHITAGGKVQAGSIYAGHNAGASGVIQVDGIGSVLNTILLYSGMAGTGAISITDGGEVNAVSVRIGFGSTGAVTVDGAGSRLNVKDGDMNIGSSGGGVLNISNGGVLAANRSVYTSQTPGESTIHFGPGGGTLEGDTLYLSKSQLTGTGTVHANGLVSDVDLVFDATHGLVQQLSVKEFDKDITLNLDLSAGGNGGGSALGAGYLGDSTLLLKDASKVICNFGYLGYTSGATGTAAVTGAGSSWTCSLLSVGDKGQGILNISGGGAVTVGNCTLGDSASARGTINVDGTGSTWTATAVAIIGYRGAGLLTISNGGEVIVKGATYVAAPPDGKGTSGISPSPSGAIVFGSNGGTLTTKSLYVARGSIAGVGTINTNGLVGDVDLVFDAGHGLKQDVVWNNGQGNVIVHLDATGIAAGMGAGYEGNGTLIVRDGMNLVSGQANLAYKAGSAGLAVIEGAGSSWSCTDMFVGRTGSGEFAIRGGANATSSSTAYLGYNV